MRCFYLRQRSLIIVLLAAAALLSACGSGGTLTEIPSLESSSPTIAAATQSVVAPTATAADLPAAPTAASEGEGAPTAGSATPTAAGTTADASDLDLVLAAFPAVPEASGDVLVLYGRVLNTRGEPLADAAVEIWQTDTDGIYDHPAAPGTADRDPAFQFYGTATADEQGRYHFRTVLPHEYGSRPPHIHLKVKLNGNTLLTSQFYFEQNRSTLGSEPLFAQAGALGDLIILAPQAAQDAAGRPVLAAQKDLVINQGEGGELTATPAQGEGPYYPVVDVSDFDNDLTRVK
jgi:protocatechuate 3,4-dioxygenase beta subunit